MGISLVTLIFLTYVQCYFSAPSKVLIRNNAGSLDVDEHHVRQSRKERNRKVYPQEVEDATDFIDQI